MWKGHLILLLRFTKRHLTYSLINVAGFAISLTCCIMVCMYVVTELSFDSFHKNQENIYRYIAKGTQHGQPTMQTWTPPGLASLISNSFADAVSQVVRVQEYDDHPAFKDEDRDLVLEKSMLLADSTFFEMFSFPLSRGEIRSALNRPLTMVISEKFAHRYFGDEDPIGKVLQYQNSYDLEITGIFADIPANSHLQFDCVVSFLSLRNFAAAWGNTGDVLMDFSTHNYATYIQALPSADIKRLEARISTALHERHTHATNRSTQAPTNWLQPLRDIHFTKGIKGDGVTGDWNNIYIAFAMGMIIMLVACFNFLNLSTVMVLKRAREVGLKKTLGAHRWQLFTQFLGECMLLIVVSLFTATALIQLISPAVQQMFGITMLDFSIVQYLLLAVTFVIITTALAGVYPAIYLSNINPTRAFRTASMGNSRSGLRMTIITFQYTISTFLLITTLIVTSQLHFIQNKDLGFHRDKIVTTFATSEIKKSYETFRTALLAHQEIEDVTISNQRVGTLQSYWRYSFPGGEADGSFGITTLIVSDNYLDFMGIKLKAGRDLKHRDTKAATEYLVNEAFIHEFGLSNAIGTQLQVAHDTTSRGEIVGIVSDFYFQPLHNAITPLILRMDSQNAWLVSVKFAVDNTEAGLSSLEKEWKKFSNGEVLDYRFLEDHLQASYQKEDQTASFLLSLSLLAITISGLGLFGLMTFMTTQRKKEIGVRKVLGATMGEVIGLFSKDLLKLQLLGFVLAAPLAWFAANQWLMNFAYHITPSPTIFISSGVIIGIFSLTIIIHQSRLAARTNPTESLRAE